jgi:hypothetical protein
MENPFELINEKLDTILKFLEDEKKQRSLVVDDEIILTRDEACKFLSIDSSTLWAWTNKGKVITYGIGARRYYKKSELMNSLIRKKV